MLHIDPEYIPMSWHKANERSFSHSGDLGDLIYSLPVIRHMGGGKVFFSFDMKTMMNRLHRAFIEFSVVKEDGSNAGITQEKMDFLKPLLLHQQYISSVQKLEGNQKIAYNLDEFRFKDGYNSIYDKYRQAFSTPLAEYEIPWLQVKPKMVSSVIMARSARHQNNQFPWREIHDKHGHYSVFVGTKEEHRQFVKDIGNITFYETNTALEMAEAIAGADMFVGNQSLPYAIAEGLKKKTIQETSRRRPDCLFVRENATYFLNGKFVRLNYTNP